MKPMRTNKKRRFEMKPTTKVFASAAVFAFVNIVTSAQTAPTWPVQIIGESQFNQMAQSGRHLFPISPAVVAAQNRQRQLTDA
jgi:hypothetical protein